MDKIIRSLRRNSNKKKSKELQEIEEDNWARAKTEEINDNSYSYPPLEKRCNTGFARRSRREKREDAVEYADVHELNKMEFIKSQLKKTDRSYANTFSLISEDTTNVSTDFTIEHSRNYRPGIDRNRRTTILNRSLADSRPAQRADSGSHLFVRKGYEEEQEEQEHSDETEEIEESLDNEESEENDEIEYSLDNDYLPEAELSEEIINEEGVYIADSYSVPKESMEELPPSSDSSPNTVPIEAVQMTEEAEIANENENENEAYVEEELNVYSPEEISAKVEVVKVKGKGRCMFTRKSLDPGEIIFIEKPILIITPGLNEPLWNKLNEINDETSFELPLKWHFAAFCSITQLDEANYNACLDKWVPETDRDPESEVFEVLDKVCEKKLTVSGKVRYYYNKKLIDPRIYYRMIQVWHYNAFGHHTDNEGLILYNRISMLAHSCNSTACWHYGKDDTFVLRARVKLNVGDELTISYLGDDDLYKSANIRREKLSNWLFVCMCSRCTNPIDNSRGFKCPTCGIGTFFIKKDDNEESPFVTKCNICLAEVNEATANQYIDYETGYVERLQDTDKSDLPDALSVYVQAEKIFSQHWILFQLSSILFEGYKEAAEWDKAIYYQMLRIKYAVDVIPRANYVLAWLYDELGEIAANAINTDILQTENDFTISYESKQRICSHFLKSISLLEILCGYSHDYIKDSLNKYYRIDSLTTTDGPQLEE